MARRRRGKLIGALLLGAVVALGAALALAAPDAGPTGAPADMAARAGRAAAALADAHPSDHAVLVLSEMARRETSALGAEPSTSAVAAMQRFADRAEEHLVSGGGDPAAARDMLSELVRALRGGGAPVPPPVPAPPAVPAVPQPPAASGETAEATVVGRDLVVEAGQVVAEASVVGGDLTVRGHVRGDAVAVGGSVHLEPGARVDGDVVSVGGQVTRDPAATVGGDQTSVGPAALTRMIPMAAAGSDSPRAAGLFGWVGKVVQSIGVALVMALVGLVILALVPARTRAIMSTIRKRPGMSLLAGILTVIILAVASVLMAVTIVLIPLIPFVLLALALAMILGMTAAAHVVGEAMPGKQRASRSSLVCLIIGIVVLGVISILPFGSLILAVASAVALGAVIISKVGAVSP